MKGHKPHKFLNYNFVALGNLKRQKSPAKMDSNSTSQKSTENLKRHQCLKKKKKKEGIRGRGKLVNIH